MYRMPAIFDSPQADGYSYAPQRPFRRSSMDSGLARHRPTSKTVVTKFNVTWMIKKELMASFRYIVFEVINWQEFETKLILDGEVKYMKAQFCNEEQPFMVESVQNVVYKVSAELECRELDLMSIGQFMADVEGYPSGFALSLDNQVNTVAPQSFGGCYLAC